MNTTKRICLWSGPRNISTALMYAFAQRQDMTVYDEPLYGHYLANSEAKDYHPGAEEILRTMEIDGSQVIEMMRGEHPTPFSFFKHMTHHLIEINRTFLKEMTNVILTRDPYEMLTSFINQIDQPRMQDVGYAGHIELLNYLETNQLPVVVLDGKNVLLNPEKVLTDLCDQIDIPFDKAMLSWQPGPRPEDGCWAKYWYHNVHKSSGFGAYKAKNVTLPKHLEPLLAACQPLYEQLTERAIQP